MTDKEIKAFVKDRDTTFIAAVMHDDWDAVRRFAKKYGDADKLWRLPILWRDC